jgi:tripartite-type tricarboxylate transporter receptor subunit TctC
MNRALQQPDTRQRLSGLGMEPLAGSEDEFAKFFRAEVAKWNKVIKAAGIKGEGE